MSPARVLPTFLVAAATAHSCLAAPPAPNEPTPTISAATFNVAFRLDSSHDAQAVHLWYTVNEGRTWRKYGPALPPTSPIAFTAEEEGLYGFYLVAENADGASADPPGPTATPHHRVFVDHTPPVVHAFPPQQLEQARPTTVRITWSATDAYLTARPIRILYRRPAAREWLPAAAALPNTGTYDWHPDDDLLGPIEIRVTAVDRAGHRTESSVQQFLVRPPRPAADSSPPASSAYNFTGPADTLAAGQTARGHRASELLNMGVRHAGRGELEMAVSFLRDALALDPDRAETLVELAGVMYSRGELQPSVDAYKLALARKPHLRPALEGLATAYIGQRRFGDAVEQLGRIVQANPRDTEAWLNLGDVAVYQGDEPLALEHYTRAATLNPTLTGIVEKAQRRMAHLKRLAEEFRQFEHVR